MDRALVPAGRRQCGRGLQSRTHTVSFSYHLGCHRADVLGLGSSCSPPFPFQGQQDSFRTAPQALGPIRVLMTRLAEGVKRSLGAAAAGVAGTKTVSQYLLTSRPTHARQQSASCWAMWADM